MVSMPVELKCAHWSAVPLTVVAGSYHRPLVVGTFGTDRVTAGLLAWWCRARTGL
jgi:hypothetical protein